MLAITESQAQQTLSDTLGRLGVRAGDRLMLGIDMAGVPLPAYRSALTRQGFAEREHRWCQFILDTIMNWLGPAGTLLVPSFSYRCGQSGNPFVAETTPSEVGPFTEYVRSRPAAVRSLHPIFSIAGIGPDANALLTGVGRAAFGSMSPFSRFAPFGVRFLCLGVELKNCITYIHHLEQSYGCPHRFHKCFDTPVSVGGRQQEGEWYAYVAYRGLGHSSNIGSLQQKLAAHGRLVEVIWNGHPNHLAETADVDETGYQLLAADPWAFVDRRLKLHMDEQGDANRSVSRLTVTGTEC